MIAVPLRVVCPRYGVPLRERKTLFEGIASKIKASGAAPDPCSLKARRGGLARQTHVGAIQRFKNKCFKINGIRPGLNSDGVYAFRLI